MPVAQRQDRWIDAILALGWSLSAKGAHFLVIENGSMMPETSQTGGFRHRLF